MGKSEEEEYLLFGKRESGRKTAFKAAHAAFDVAQRPAALPGSLASEELKKIKEKVDV